MIIVSALLIILFTPRLGAIGRLPSIEEWLGMLFAGEFPYNSGLTPSSFPGLFLMALPLWLIGNAGLIEIAGLILFFYLVFSIKDNFSHLKIFLLVSTPVFYYGIAVRCELFFNMSLVIFTAWLVINHFGRKNKMTDFFILPLLVGLGLSTRSVVLIFYVIFMLWYFRDNLGNLVKFSIPMSLLFISLLLPLYFWDKESFMNNGPFAIQSRLSALPSFIVAFFLIASVYLGWIVRSFREVLFSSGVIIFLMVIISFILKIFDHGFAKAFYADLIDLSYLAFPLPLFILSIEFKKHGHFTGEILYD